MVKGFSAYDSALMFSSSFKILLTEHMLARTTRNYEKFTLLIPAMVNGAFACELFLKALLGTPLRGHKLYNDLFCKLDLSTAQEIETVTIECLKKKKNTIINSEQFISNFKVIERSFEEFRYFYEPQYSGTRNEAKKVVRLHTRAGRLFRMTTIFGNVSELCGKSAAAPANRLPKTAARVHIQYRLTCCAA